jgi:uncharacterized protein GlcG (DUF336 family)
MGLLSFLRGRRGGQASGGLDTRCFRPTVEALESRTAPALLAGELAPLTPPTPAPVVLTKDQVNTLLERAAAATASDNAIVAVVDRNGSILGVRVEGNVDPAITGNTANLVFAIDGAVSEARTAAFFANNTAPLTSRTVQYISQSTITQREVQSNPDIPDKTSPLWGPGFVAPIGVGGHFPPGIDGTPSADLFGIEHTNRDSLIVQEPNGTTITLPSRFNVPTQFIPPGVSLVAPESYGQVTGMLPTAQSRGIGTLPGGIPLYDNGELVGGIGVFFPGKTGYASEENSSLGATFNPALPDLSLEAEFIAFAAAGGSSGAGAPIGTLGGVAPLPGFDLPFGRIDLAGITLPLFGPGGDQGPQNLLAAAQHFGPGQGNAASGKDQPVNAQGDKLLGGAPVPDGWLVTPHDGVGITAAEVTQIINQGIAEANLTRAQIRLPLGATTRMVFAVADSTGAVLGLYRMPDATVFSINVAVAKARNVAYYDDPALLQPIDQVPGVPAGASLTNRTFRYLAQPTFPEGIDGKPPAPFSILNDPHINPTTALNSGPPLPASAYTSIYAHDAFFPDSNFHAPTDPANQNGVVFFPGSSAVYKLDAHGNLVIGGGFGVSGDGVNQDDFVTAAGIKGFGPPPSLQADNFSVNGIRLPYQNFPRNPTDL